MLLTLYMYVCPLHKSFNQHHVLDAGVTYEREAIRRWFDKRRVSPVTGLEVASTMLTPNLAMRSALAQLREERARLLSGGGAPHRP